MPIDQIVDPEFDCINLDELLRRLNNCAKGLLCIIILDACRADESNNVFKMKGDKQEEHHEPAFGKALSANIRLPSESQFALIYSSDPGTVSFAGTNDGNSLFTSVLLNNLEIPKLTLAEIMTEVTKETMKKSRNRQRPWLSLCLTEAFYFKEGL